MVRRFKSMSIINNTRRLILFIFMVAIMLSLVIEVSFADDVTNTWAKYYTIPSGRAVWSWGGRINTILQTTDGDYVVAGERPYSDGFVMRLDKNGQIQWEHRYGSYSAFWGDTLNYISQTKDNGFITLGKIGDVNGGYGRDAWILKLNEAGTIEWQKTFGDSSFTGHYYLLHSIQQTTDGGYIAAGVVTSDPSLDADANFWIVKLDTVGNIQWQKRADVPAVVSARSIKQTIDGGYIVLVGQQDWNGYDAVIFKLDGQGNIQWQKKYGINSGFNYDKSSIQQTSDGGYVIAHSQTYLFKIDGAGNILWQNRVTTDYNKEGITSLQLTADGGFVASGSSSDSYYRGWLIKFNSSGSVQWQKTFESDLIIPTSDVKQTDDMGYIIAGNACPGGRCSWLQQELYPLIMKLDAYGNAAGCAGKMIRDGNEMIQNSNIPTLQTSIKFTNYSAPIRDGVALENDIVISPRSVCVEASPNITVNPVMLNFNSVELFDHATQFVTASNTVNVPLIFNAIGITGADANNFVQTNTCTTLQGVGSCTIAVTFTPLSTGPKVATLNIVSNDPDTPTISVSLTGTGADTTPPSTAKMVSGVLGNNEWYTSDVVIQLIATDAGSGVKEIHYSIDGAQTIIAANTASFTISTEGVHTITYYAKDNAGNSEAAHVFQLKIDKTLPVITGTKTPAQNAYGWNNTDVIVDFTCNDSVSGIASCSSPVTVSTEGAGQNIIGTAVDNAGNTATVSLPVNIDKTPPIISWTTSPAPNANGWYNTDVTVTFTCSDHLSGIATCPAPITVTTEGAGQVITGTAVDKAGNSATVSVALNIDKTPPSVTLSANPAVLWPPNHKMVNVMVTGSAIDSTSGIASVVFTVVDEYGLVQPVLSGFNTAIPLEAWREGTDMDGRHYTILAVVTDKAGNQITASTVVVVPHDMRQ